METNAQVFIKNNYFNKVAKYDFNPIVNSIILPIDHKNYMSISTKDIVRLEAYNNYTLFYFADGNTLLASKTMKEFTARLDSYFIRIHNKFIINLRYLDEYDVSNNMNVTLKGGKKLAISRRRKKEFISKTNGIFGKIATF